MKYCTSNTNPNERTDCMQGETSRWVVYLMTMGKQSGMRAVCEQAEWDAMELARPGYHQLIQSGIANENEAERLARSELVLCLLSADGCYPLGRDSWKVKLPGG